MMVTEASADRLPERTRESIRHGMTTVRSHAGAVPRSRKLPKKNAATTLRKETMPVTNENPPAGRMCDPAAVSWLSNSPPAAALIQAPEGDKNCQATSIVIGIDRR